MSDDGDIDVESAEDVPDIAVEATATTAEDRSEVYSPTGGPLDKRAHHNALERRRRDHIKDSFHGLRDSIPSLCGEKISRAIILNKATDYIRVMQKSGSQRENEIQDLKKRNEVLEEQVRALEAAKALGSTESAEEILQSVADKIEVRQRQQQSKSSSSSAAGKIERTIADKAVKTGQAAVGGANKQPATVIKSGESSTSLTNHINMLAKNQSLLTVLQKNLSSPNLPASIKSLAARVLASPLSRTQVNAGGSVPRGIVTATTVPKGSSFTSSPLPTTLQQQLQHTKPNQVPVQTVVKSAADNSKVPRAKATDNNKVSLPSASNCTSSTSPALSDDPSAEDKPPTDSSSSLAQTTSSGSSNSTSGAPVASLSSSSSSSLSVPTSEVIASSLASQLLDAHSLLQKQGAGSPSSATNSNKSLISPELLAQVSSFLNLPSLTTLPPAVSESTATSERNSSASECLSSEAVLTGVKRPNSSPELDSEHSSSKKIHLEV